MKQDTQGFEVTIHSTESVYLAYKNTISELIAYVEVYEHDLPGNIMAQTAELFQNISLCELDTSFPHNDELKNLLDQTTLKITQSLYKHSIYLFMRKIREYKRIFRRFKYKGVLIDNQNFSEMAKKIEAEIHRGFLLELRKYYKGKTLLTLKKLPIKFKLLYLLSKIAMLFPGRFLFLISEPFLPEDRFIVGDNTEIGLKTLYFTTKDFLEKYQEVFPHVVSNGTNQTLGMSIFVAISSWIVPVLLSIPVIEKLICTIKDCFS